MRVSILGHNLEYIVTNGIGEYAFSTVSGTPKRPYHGALLPAPESIGTSGHRIHMLSCFKQKSCLDSGQSQPSFQNLSPTNFERFPVPTLQLEADDVVLGPHNAQSSLGACFCAFLVFLCGWKSLFSGPNFFKHNRDSKCLWCFFFGIYPAFIMRLPKLNITYTCMNG